MNQTPEPTASTGSDDLSARISNECGLGASDAEAIARAIQNDLVYEPEMDDYMITVVRRFQSYGSSPADLGEWFRVATDLNVTLRFAALGYTPHQFEAIRDTHFSRFHGQLESGYPFGEDPAWVSWEDLLDTVPPDFLIRCLKAQPRSDDEIRGWNHRREAGDPDIEAQLDTLGGLLPDTMRNRL